jgi:hypothetical protein
MLTRASASPAPSAPSPSRRHTAGEISAKTKAATQNAGGGSEGMRDRLGGAAGHSKFKCGHCGAPLTSIAQARDHHASKHDKLPFADADYIDVHAIHGGVTTVGVAVRGTTNAEKLKKKAEK